MTNYNLWNQTLVPGTSETSVGVRTDGLYFTVSSKCTLTGMWFYAPSLETNLTGSTYTIGLWTAASLTANTGTLVTSNAGSGTLTAGAWNFFAFTTPQTLSTGTNYVVGITGHTQLQFLHNYWTTGGAGASGITSGPVTAMGAGPGGAQTAFQQPTVSGSGLLFPNSSSGTWYPVDIEVSNIYLVQTSDTNGNFGSNTTVGNTILMSGYAFNGVGGINSNTPTIGGTSVTGTKLVDGNSPGASNVVYFALWELNNITVAGTSVGLSYTGTGVSSQSLVAFEFANVPTSGLTATTNSGAGLSVVSPTDSGSITDNYLLVVSASVGYALTLTPPGAPWINKNGNSNFAFSGYQIPTQSATYDYQTTYSSTGNWTSGIAGIKVSGATNISVSDFAGQVEAFAITATVPISDAAGTVEAESESVTLTESDVAGVADSISATASLILSDAAGAVESFNIGRALSLSDTAGVTEAYVVTVTGTLRDTGASFDSIFVPNNNAANPLKPAIVLVAAAYAPVY